ncbi:NADH-quinone oxidoreductase subunit K [Desulfurococcaceae archaeon MEX13E-LK6-19]|nr:NADH-quinone oxidoreductase subunit K [Desulfurococcaceae archaeon MEX13E-LK6-19]
MSMFVNLGIALYGVLAKPSLIKKIIALTILSDTANTFAIIIGYKRWPTPETPVKPPVLTTPNPSVKDVANFITTAVDPLPQALVLTAIVIGLAVTLFLVFLTLQAYRLYGTTDVRKIARLKG